MLIYGITYLRIKYKETDEIIAHDMNTKLRT